MDKEFYIVETTQNFTVPVYNDTLVDDINGEDVENVDFTLNHFELRLARNHTCLTTSSDLDKILSMVVYYSNKYRDSDGLYRKFRGGHVGEDAEYHEGLKNLHYSNYRVDIKDAVSKGLSIPYRRVKLGVLDKEPLPFEKSTERKKVVKKKKGLKRRNG